MSMREFLDVGRSVQAGLNETVAGCWKKMQPDISSEKEYFLYRHQKSRVTGTRQRNVSKKKNVLL